MKKYLPFLDWMFPYDKSNLSGDISAGLTVGIMLIPQGMAYAMLAGLPPIFGLYSVTIPLIVYALLGTSRQLSVGPAALISLLIASGVGQLAETGSVEYIMFAILLALMVGVIQFSMGVLKLGFLVNFLAHPVIAGFISAAAIIIGFSQLKHLLGINVPRGKVHETIMVLFEKISEINYPTLALGLGSIAILLVLKKVSKKFPGQLLVVFLTMGFVYGLELQNLGVKIVKDIPSGFPTFGLPKLDIEAIKSLLPIALTISFVGFMQSIAVAKAMEAKHKNYKISANQELRALGMANIVGSFFKAFPITGGFGRTAVNNQAGAKTGLASIISSVLIIITILFLTKYFYYLPFAVLAAIVMVAVSGLVDYEEAIHLWRTDRQDFFLFMTTAVVTIAVGIEEGIMAGVALSIMALVYNSSMPHIAELGEIEHGIFRNINRFPNARKIPNTSIIRLDAQLFFANTAFFSDQLHRFAKQSKNIIIHCGSIERLDSSAVHVLSDIVEEYQNKDTRIIFTDVIGPVRDVLKKNDMFNKIGEENFFISVKDAVEAVEGSIVKDGEHEIKFQSNI